MFGGKTFGFNLSTLNEISMPRLAKGGVLYEETAFIGGEYSGARTNPEIVTPESKMEEVFDRVMSRYITDNDKTIYLTVNVGNRKLGQILLEDLRDKKRQSGKDIVICYGR